MPWPSEEDVPQHCSAQGDNQEVPDFVPPPPDSPGSEVEAGCSGDRGSMVDEVKYRF